MIGALNHDTFFATVAMARQGTTMLILVVEGEDDHLLINRHVDPSSMLLIKSPAGKAAALAAARRAQQQNLGGLRFLIDADYDKHLGLVGAYPNNVVASISHDAVMDIVGSSAALLERLIDVYGRSPRRRGLSFSSAALLAEAFVMAQSVVPLRIVNHRRGYGLVLRDFPFSLLPSTSPTSLEVATAALKRSAPAVAATDLAAEMESERTAMADGLVDAVGDHDFFGALAEVLRRHGAKVGIDSVWAGFLAAVDCTHLRATNWYSVINAWAASSDRRAFRCA